MKILQHHGVVPHAWQENHNSAGKTILTLHLGLTPGKKAEEVLAAFKGWMETYKPIW